MGENRRDSEYYLKSQSKWMKFFDKSQKLAREILTQYFEDSTVDRIIRESRGEFGTLILQLPDVGGKRNIWLRDLIMTTMMLAFVRVIEKEKLPLREIGKIIYEFPQRYFESLPHIAKWIARQSMFSGWWKAKIKRRCEDSQLRRYPGDWAAEFIEGDGRDFDYGIDIFECAICKFYKQQGAEKYLPYVCLSDYAMACAFGFGLARTQTIGNGAPKCDIRLKKRGVTQPGWPPENLKEFKKE